MKINRTLVRIAAAAAVAAIVLAAPMRSADVTLLNVSYDPTRELYEEFNAGLRQVLEGEDRRERRRSSQSHGGSGKQARAVIDGLRGRRRHAGARRRHRRASPTQGKLLPADWQSAAAAQQRALHLDHRVPGAQGQPQGHQGLGRPRRSRASQVITPNPKTSGGARWNYLAAWALGAEAAGRQRREGAGVRRASSSRTCRCSTPARAARPPPSRSAASATCCSPGRTRRSSPSKELGAGQVRDRRARRSASSPSRRSRWSTRSSTATRHARTSPRPTSSTSTRRKARRSSAKHFYRPRDPEVAAKYAKQFPKIDAGHHRRTSAAGRQAQEALRRRRRLRPDLRALTRLNASGDPRTGRRQAPVASCRDGRRPPTQSRRIEFLRRAAGGSDRHRDPAGAAGGLPVHAPRARAGLVHQPSSSPSALAMLTLVAGVLPALPLPSSAR